ncbi:MAG: DUF1592 domain-containing protein [Planctomycetota bacterium]
MIQLFRPFLFIALLGIDGLLCATDLAAVDQTIGAETAELASFFATHCMDCHSGDEAEADFQLNSLDWSDLVASAESLEKSLAKIRGHQMPPADSADVDKEIHARTVESLESLLDTHAANHVYAGRTEAVRRLTRTEYKNAMRDLLDLEVNVEKLLPKDEESHGFDNILVANLSPTLMDRYVNAAQQIARQAVGGVGRSVGGETIRIPADITQEDRIPGLPWGTRGGTKFTYHFPQDGEYEFQLRLARDRNEHVEGIKREHELQILVNRQLLKSFQVRPPKKQDHASVDKHLQVRLPIAAGSQEVIITFVKESDSLVETMRQPFESKFNTHRHPRQTPALYEITIVGPYDATGPGNTSSRDKVFVVRPDSTTKERQCAEQIIEHLTRRAFRRPVTIEDTSRPLEFYESAREKGKNFDGGIQAALTSILVSPKFLFRIESTIDSKKRSNAQISDEELASRLSFFLWGSIPDETLLRIAELGELRDPKILKSQVQRMLADPKAENLVSNFAGQWLYLRNLESITPDARLFPDFDDNLRQAFRRETEYLFREIIQENRSVLDLIRSDHSFLNERLAKHYGIPRVYGSHFRRVDLASANPNEPNDSTAREKLELARRGGLLRHASILMVTSYATRTSPVLRGNWVLENLLGNPPPPPPANVPALEENDVAADLPIRERLAAHRNNAACSACHQLIDPVGFALENFDAIGRWRDFEAEVAIDSKGNLPGGQEFEGVEGLEQAIMDTPEWFVSTLTRKLMTFGLGRGVEPLDEPVVRRIVRDSAKDDFRFQSIIYGIVSSPAFQLRSTGSPDLATK